MNKEKGFTLVELLISMAIIVLLAVFSMSVLKPKLLTGKANDSLRKKDLSKVKVAFEEYFNDMGVYPSYNKVRNWNVSANCGKEVTDISAYLDKWPCDPVTNKPYVILTDQNWFKVVTNLENKNDKDIPKNWYITNNYVTTFDKNEVNYGVSSSNILWYETNTVTACGSVCLKLNSSGCNDVVGVGCSLPDICYYGTCTLSGCRTNSCK